MHSKIVLPAFEVPIKHEVDVLVVGGGPAGVAAAVCASRMGVETLLVERYSYLGGLATGAMVLQMNDMCDDDEIVIAGVVNEFEDRMRKFGGILSPSKEELFKSSTNLHEKWIWWGVLEKYGVPNPDKVIHRPIIDVENMKYVCQLMMIDAGVKIKFHSIFTKALVEGNQVTGAIFFSKEGYYGVKAKIIIDATGDGDVFSSAGAEYNKGNYIITTSHFMANVDTQKLQNFSKNDPKNWAEIYNQTKEIYGLSWSQWMFLTVNPGEIWCDCPHFAGKDALSIDQLTEIEIEGRERIWKALTFLKKNMPGFEEAYISKVGDQTGVRQSRLLVGEYVLTSNDINKKVRFKDSIGRGGRYTYPYRSLVPIKLDGLLAVGRHFSVKPSAQARAREWPPCMVTGQAAGVAASIALSKGVQVRDISIDELQIKLGEQGVIL